MVYGSLVESNICLESHWDLVMNECSHCIVLIKLQLNELLFFFTIEIIALDGQSVKILLTSNCLSV